MAIDVVLVTETGAPIGPVSHYCVEQSASLVVVAHSKSTDSVAVPFHEMRAGVSLTLLRSSKSNTVSSAVFNALSFCKNPWVLIINDTTFEAARDIHTIRSVAETIPRLASIHSSSIPGIHAVNSNPLMGTLYSTSVLKNIAGFEPTVPDISMVAYDWARATRDRGWAHITTYVEGTDDSPRSVSSGEEREDFSEEKSRDGLVIPRPGPINWMGSFKRRPWHYKATVVIPHYGRDLRLLTNVIESWRLQTERPYIVVYDTGTSAEYHSSLRALASYDTEVHFCRWHGVRNPYDPVALAYNHGITDCRTKHILFTHNDIVPLSQTVVSELISSSFEDVPVVGYESSAVHNIVGTQLTIAHMPTLRRIRAVWDIIPTYNWIEEGFNTGLKQAGVTPRFIGKEKSYRYKTPHFDHVGSWTTANLYVSTDDVVCRVRSDLEQVLAEAEARLRVWRGS